MTTENKETVMKIVQVLSFIMLLALVINGFWGSRKQVNDKEVERQLFNDSIKSLQFKNLVEKTDKQNMLVEEHINAINNWEVKSNSRINENKNTIDGLTDSAFIMYVYSIRAKDGFH